MRSPAQVPVPLLPATEVLIPKTVHGDTLPLHAFLTFKLVALANALQTQVTRHYVAPNAPLGLTEWRLMGLLHEHGEMHASALAKLSAIDKGQISRTLQPLIDRQWIFRRVDPEHGLRHLLQLTEEGQRLFRIVLEQARPMQAELWNVLSVPERAALEHIMDKLTAAAQKIDDQEVAQRTAARKKPAALESKSPPPAKKSRAPAKQTSA